MSRKFSAVTLIVFLAASMSASSNAFVYKKDSKGVKIFSSEWNKTKKIGTVTFEIESPYKEGSTNPGKYDLATSKGNGLFASGEKCDVKITGSIEYTEKAASSVTPIVFTFTGDECQKFVETFAYRTPVSLPVWRIDSASGEVGLSIRISNSALTECGIGSTMAEKVSDCATKNKNLAHRIVRTEKANSWTLAAFDEKSTAVWRDEATKIYWSGPPKIGKGATWQEAVDTCKSDQFLRTLPSPKAFESAVTDGLFRIYPQSGAYWTSETLEREGRTLGSTYQTLGISPIDSLEATIGDLVDVKRKLYYQCIGQ